MKPEVYTVPQAAKICSVSRGTIWRWVKTGKLRAAVTAGGHHRIAADDLLEFTELKHIEPRPEKSKHQKRVLVVDDDPTIRKLLSGVFGGDGYKLDFAVDGFEAGQKSERFKPHLVILDLFMPQVNGFEVCKRLKSDPTTQDVKVFAMSGYNTKENRQEILACGADLFFPKPLDIKALRNEVDALLAS
ncbi:MAG: response regulator [Deltaproteobacteria bacterium]|nr:response regulator [Deltaproteobacteria bacterium]